MAQTLAQFSITRTSDGDYILHLEDEDGNSSDFQASFDLLDEIGDSIEDALEGDDDFGELGNEDEADEEEAEDE